MTTTQGWRDLIEVALMRQTTAYDLVCECVELYGPTSTLAAAAYTNWLAASEQHEVAEREYLVWLKEHRRVVAS